MRPIYLGNCYLEAGEYWEQHKYFPSYTIGDCILVALVLFVQEEQLGYNKTYSTQKFCETMATHQFTLKNRQAQRMQE